MYQSYWKLNEKPFANTPDPRFLYPAPQHEDALMKLTYAVVERMGAAMLTGVFGCGKTIVGRAIQRDLGADKYKFAFISHPHPEPLDLLRAIVRNLRAGALPEKKTEVMADALLELLGGILVDNARDGKETVILMDEAHAITSDQAFEELRLLLNFQQEDRFLLTLLLFGQPELTQKVDTLKPFAQRIAIRCHVGQLAPQETAGYIQHRLQVAGAQGPLFEPEAVAFIHERTGGIPRRINHLCDMALLSGFGKQAEAVDLELVKKTAEEFGA